jgi:predicted  nucleic acid-binding Zn-ribbon protein
LNDSVLHSLQVSKSKLIHVLEEFAALQISLTEARQKVKTLEQQLESEKNTRLVLTEQNKIAKLADAMLKNGADAGELEKTIDKHIRNINTCIRLLSDR